MRFIWNFQISDPPKFLIGYNKQVLVHYTIILTWQHFNNFYILMLGRLLGGIATSILYSAFESWMVYEHHKVGGAREVISLKKKLFELYFGILRGE